MNTATDVDQRARAAFEALSESERRAAICRLIDDGLSEYGAAVAAGVSVEFVRGILGERSERAADRPRGDAA